jgi:single-strand DNA-binding protein
MSSLNTVILLGGLTRDPELRHTAGGQVVAKFSLAMTETYRDKAGETKETTCYIDIDAWGKLGELCANSLRRGSQALISGKLQMEQWTAKDGTKRSKHTVRAIEVQFLSRPGSVSGDDFADAPASATSRRPVPNPPPPFDDDDDPVPF